MKPVPKDIRLEQSVIGALLLDPERIWPILAQAIAPETFWDERHRAIVRATARLGREVGRFNYEAIEAELRRTGEFEKIGERRYVTECFAASALGAHVEGHVHVLRDLATYRAIVEAGERITAIGHGAEGPAVEAVRESRALLGRLDGNPARGPVTIGEAISEEVLAFEDVAKDAMPPIRTGFRDLDAQTGGLDRKRLAVVAGRPGMGKSAFVAAVAQNAAERGIRVAWFALEEDARTAARRLLSRAARVPNGAIKRRELDEARWRDVLTAAKGLYPLAITVDERRPVSGEDLRARAWLLKERKGLDLVIVDHLGLMRERGRHETRHAEMTVSIEHLCALAKDLDVAVLAVHQLNRQVEGRQDRHPQLSDLRESGSVEENARLVLLLFRPWYYSRKVEDDGKVEVTIAKQSDGPTGVVELRFEARYVSMEDPPGNGTPARLDDWANPA